jgi:hypothetical protein
VGNGFAAVCAAPAVSTAQAQTIRTSVTLARFLNTDLYYFEALSKERLPSLLRVPVKGKDFTPACITKMRGTLHPSLLGDGKRRTH